MVCYAFATYLPSMVLYWLPRWLDKESEPAGDPGSIPGLRRSSRRRNGNLLKYSCLGNPLDRGDWQATVHGVAKCWTRPSMHPPLYWVTGRDIILWLFPPRAYLTLESSWKESSWQMLGNFEWMHREMDIAFFGMSWVHTLWWGIVYTRDMEWVGEEAYRILESVFKNIICPIIPDW